MTLTTNPTGAGAEVPIALAPIFSSPRGRRTCRRVAATSLALVALLATPAFARETPVLRAAHAAADSERGKGFLLAVPFRMKGEPIPTAYETLHTITVSRASSGAFRSDGAACDAAFLDALKVLQQMTLDAGGNAIVDVESTTGGTDFESPSDFRCVAGSAVVHVGLRGTAVRVEKADNREEE